MGKYPKNNGNVLSFLFGGVIHIADWIIPQKKTLKGEGTALELIEDSTSIVAYEYSIFFPHQMMVLDLVNPV